MAKAATVKPATLNKAQLAIAQRFSDAFQKGTAEVQQAQASIRERALDAAHDFHAKYPEPSAAVELAFVRVNIKARGLSVKSAAVVESNLLALFSGGAYRSIVLKVVAAHANTPPKGIGAEKLQRARVIEHVCRAVRSMVKGDKPVTYATLLAESNKRYKAAAAKGQTGHGRSGKAANDEANPAQVLLDAVAWYVNHDKVFPDVITDKCMEALHTIKKELSKARVTAMAEYI